MLAYGSRFLSPQTGTLAALTLWGNTTLVLVAATPRIDTTLCLFTFLGHCALLRAVYEQDGRRYYLLAALLLGAAIGVKLHALAYVMAVMPLVVWVAIKQILNRPVPRPGKLTGDLSIALGMFALAGVLASLPWLVRNQLMVGAPFYPLLASPRMPPWMTGLFSATDIPTSVDTYAYAWISLVRSPFNLIDVFVAPDRLTIEPEGTMYFFSPLLLLLPLWLIRPSNGAANWLAGGGIAYLLILLVPFPRTNLRYLLPAAVPLMLVAAHGLVLASSRLRAKRLVQFSIAAVALLPTALAVLVWSLGTYAVGHVVGTRSENEYVTGTSGSSVIDLRSLLERVPSGGRALFLFEARGYGSNRQVLQDNVGTNWALLVEAGAVDRCLAGTGITHVLVNRTAIDYYVSRGLDANRLQWHLFSRFEKDCLDEIGRTAGLSLYRIRHNGDTL
jgi:hypothetical protein